MRHFLIFMLLILTTSVKAQYTTYTIENVGSISITDEMELQGGSYREKVNDFLHSFSEYNIGYEDRIVFQPNGINSYDKLNQTYARIIIETEYGYFDTLTSTKPVVSVKEMRELNTMFKNQLIQGFKGTQLSLVEFYGVSLEKINNQVSLKISYTRRLNDNPLVRVDMYKFQNKDRMHTLTLSYRIDHQHRWKDKLTYSLNSFKIFKQ